MTGPPPAPRKRPVTRRLLRVAAVLVAVLVVGGAAAWLGRFEILRRMQGMPPYSHDAGSERTEMVAMRDGVRLTTTIYLPEGDQDTWPTVLIRNPYARFDDAESEGPANLGPFPTPDHELGEELKLSELLGPSAKNSDDDEEEKD